MRSGIDLSGWMQLQGDEGFIILQVDETGWVIEVEFDTGLELTVREPRAFNESLLWKTKIKCALEAYEQDRAREVESA
jgi:hypothetical protein